MCVGEIGIPPSEFWNMTYKETILAIRGYDQRQLREWERSRLISYQVYLIGSSKRQNKPIHEYLPLPSDRTGGRRRSYEEMQKAKAFFLNKNKNLNEKENGN